MTYRSAQVNTPPRSLTTLLSGKTILAAFTDKEINDNFYIWQMFRDGSVSLIYRDDVYQKITGDLRGLGYEVCEINCQFAEKRELEKELRRALALSDGRGLDAFNSQLGDWDFPDCIGFVIALVNLGEFNRQFKQYLWDVVDILVNESRLRMLRGQRLLVMLHASEKIEIDSVGAIRVTECFLKTVPDPDTEFPQ